MARTLNKEKRKRGVLANSLSEEILVKIVQYLKENINPSSGEPFLTTVKRKSGKFYRCNMSCIKDAKGNDKWPQKDLTRFGFRHKVLVHHIWWRYENSFAPIPDGLDISHLDADHQVLRLVAESRDVNESRKYCHLFKWYKPLPGEPRPRCPHWNNPCSGP